MQEVSGSIPLISTTKKKLQSLSPSSRGLGHRPFTAITRVRISLGTPLRFASLGSTSQRPAQQVCITPLSFFIRNAVQPALMRTPCFALSAFSIPRNPPSTATLFWAAGESTTPPLRSSPPRRGGECCSHASLFHNFKFSPHQGEGVVRCQPKGASSAVSVQRLSCLPAWGTMRALSGWRLLHWAVNSHTRSSWGALLKSRSGEWRTNP